LIASTHRNRTAHLLATVLLAAGVLQVLATLNLNVEPLRSKISAAQEGSLAYIVTAAVATLGFAGAWRIRRASLTAIALFIVWQTLLVFGARNFVTQVGLAYHGEFILFHFVAILGTVLCIKIPMRWAFHPRLVALGHARILPLVTATTAGLLLAVGHLSSLPQLAATLETPWLLASGTALMLFAWLLALGLFWRQLSPPKLRVAGLLLLLPFVARIALAGQQGLAGAPVAGSSIAILGTVVVLVATLLAVLLLFPPRVEWWMLFMILLVSASASAFFYLLYIKDFGNFEGDQGALLQSFLGFNVPYREYVSDWKSTALMIGITLILTSVYGSLVSVQDRPRGVALGLIAVAGLSLGSPHLTLMVGAGALLFIDSLLESGPHPESSPSDVGAIASSDFAPVLAELALGLNTAPPVRIDAKEGPLTAMQGNTGDIRFGLRFRPQGRDPRITLTVGYPGRDKPLIELIPAPRSAKGPRGKRPEHSISGTHRLSGNARLLEKIGDDALDSLSAFPRAHLQLWDAGACVDIRGPSVDLNAAQLESLIRSLALALGQ